MEVGVAADKWACPRTMRIKIGLRRDFARQAEIIIGAEVDQFRRRVRLGAFRDWPGPKFSECVVRLS